MLDTKTLAMLRKEALDARIKTIGCISSSIGCISSFGSGHIGGAMSVMDLLVYLYFKEMKVRPEEPLWDKRDRLVLSKGHAGPALYAVLAKKGYFPESWLATLNQGGTRLPSHVDMLKTPGVDFAVGIAAAQRVLGYADSWTYAIVGDGESQEGEVWEAAEDAAAWKLDNFIAFTDVNGQQLDDYTDNIVPMHQLRQRYETFGFDTYEINGMRLSRRPRVSVESLI